MADDSLNSAAALRGGGEDESNAEHEDDDQHEDEGYGALSFPVKSSPRARAHSGLPRCSCEAREKHITRRVPQAKDKSRDGRARLADTASHRFTQAERERAS